MSLVIEQSILFIFRTEVIKRTTFVFILPYLNAYIIWVNFFFKAIEIASAITQGGDILLLITSPNNCLFSSNEQVPVDRNMLVFFFLALYL